MYDNDCTYFWMYLKKHKIVHFERANCMVWVISQKNCYLKNYMIFLNRLANVTICIDKSFPKGYILGIQSLSYRLWY